MRIHLAERNIRQCQRLLMWQPVYEPESKMDEYRNAMDAVVEKRDDTKLFDEDFGPVIRGY
ncbi:MAG: hypothetical protein K2I10_06630 [Lachnospiraceae bacterium]|nr:hypothetical protein [Lachnospiraceae bacterium]